MYLIYLSVVLVITIFIIAKQFTRILKVASICRGKLGIKRGKEPELLQSDGEDESVAFKIPFGSKKGKINKSYNTEYKQFGKNPFFPECMEAYNRGISANIPMNPIGSSKTYIYSAFENQESDDDQTEYETLKNSCSDRISFDCNSNEPLTFKDGTLDNKNWMKDHTPKIDKDCFYVRTFDRRGSCIVKVPLEKEELDILKKENDNPSINHNPTEPNAKEIDQLQKSNEGVLTNPTEDFSDLSHSKFEKNNCDLKEEKDNSNNLLKDFASTDEFVTSNEGSFTSLNLDEHSNLLHEMDDSGKIVWNLPAEKYNVDICLWDDELDCDVENILKSAAMDNPFEAEQQCNTEIILSDELGKNHEDLNPKNILENDNNVDLENIPYGVKPEVQYQDPGINTGSFVSDQCLILSSEPPTDYFV